MATLHNPDLTKDCTDLIASIHTDAHFTPSTPTSANRPKEWDTGGFDALPEDTLNRLRDLTSDALTASTSPPNSATTSQQLIRLIDEELETTYKSFYNFVYSDLPYCWRLLYTELALLKFSLLILDNAKNPAGGGGGGDGQHDEEREDNLLTTLVAILDKALILSGGAGVSRGRKAISRLLKHLDAASPSSYTSQALPLPPTFPTTRIFDPPVRKPISTVEDMTMSDFQRYLDNSSSSSRPGEGPEPLVLKGLMTDWPARSTRRWDSPTYLLSKTSGGRRLVPVEVGRSYVDEGWTQELISFRELLTRISASPPRPAVAANSLTNDNDDSPGQQKTTYLAQHELLTQLPELRKDILTPDHCFTTPPPHPLDPSRNKPELDLPLVNAWFGPAGTITPLHTDGYHNLLCQVVGAKYLRLYSPRDSEALCPRVEGGDGVDMSNTSAFDVGVVEGWDEDVEGRDPIELEEFRGLRYWDCVLEAGDVLYVPMGWWHYVRSLSVSFSVSFWWNGDHYIAAGG